VPDEPIPEPEVLPEAHSVTIVCPECGSLVRIRDVHAYVLSNHFAVCSELKLVTGSQD
jgi:predicted RNA-binding Zn-ribbon protein involved in translation (DUF1610 family)